MKHKPYLAVAGIALVVSMLGGTAQAYFFCSEPSEPSCVSGYVDFNNQYSFDSCRRDVENYLSEVADYRSCLVRAIDDAAEQANQVIEKFNCKAEGNSFCP